MIVDMEKARAQLALFNSDNDDRVATAIAAAHAAVFTYLKRDAATRWFDESTGVQDVPTDVGHAILMCCELLFYDANADPFTPGVVSLLAMYRDPALA